jgi:signal transduction histidine kinase
VCEDTRIGDITIRHRTGQRALAQRERHALLAASEPIIAGIASVRLTAELAESRSASAAVREEERKVLGQELHDELVPSLAVVRHRFRRPRLVDHGRSNISRRPNPPSMQSSNS